MISSLFAATELAAAGVVRGAAPNLDQRVSLDFKVATATEAFEAVARMGGMSVTVDPLVFGEVTIHLEHVRLRVTLDALCDTVGCSWQVGEGGQLQVKPAAMSLDSAEGIDLKVTDAEVAGLLQLVGRLLQAEVSIDPAVSGKATLKLENTPLRQALDEICKAGHCSWSLDESGGTKVLRIVPGSPKPVNASADELELSGNQSVTAKAPEVHLDNGPGDRGQRPGPSTSSLCTRADG